MRNFLSEEQAHDEARAGAGRAVHRERAPVRGHDGAGDGEAEAGAAGVAGAAHVETDEGLEDPLDVGRGDAGPRSETTICA